MAKRGPRTDTGRAAVRLNAVKHGVFSASPVVLGLEREEDWLEHLEGILDGLVPRGHLESTLAERAALLLWRLGRVARYETEAINVGQESAEEDAYRDPNWEALQRMLRPESPGNEDGFAVRLHRLTRERLLPKEDVISKVTRYEAHLHRQLLQTMHELEALQSRRRGEAAPLARVDVQGLPEGT